MTADEIISSLNLKPHPEGGYYKEMFRDNETFGTAERSFSTAIYFLLKAGRGSHWHAVDAVEIWHYYQGAPLKLDIAAPSGPLETQILGSELGTGARPQIVIPRGYWQRARSLGDYTLMGCTVAPGFEFSGFTLAPEGFEPGV